MRRSMATVLSELDYRGSAWAEHADIAKHIQNFELTEAHRIAVAKIVANHPEILTIKNFEISDENERHRRLR